MESIKPVFSDSIHIPNSMEINDQLPKSSKQKKSRNNSITAVAQLQHMCNLPFKNWVENCYTSWLISYFSIVFTPALHHYTMKLYIGVRLCLSRPYSQNFAAWECISYLQTCHPRPYIDHIEIYTVKGITLNIFTWLTSFWVRRNTLSCLQ